MTPRLPAAGRVDAAQLRALVRLTLSDLVRPGTDPTTGVRGHPLRQIVFSMGVLGLMAALNVRRFADAEGFVLAAFVFVPGTLALAILPDTFEVRERKMEILRSKPLTGETLLAARTASLLAVCLLMSGTLGLPPLLAAAWRFPELAAWRVAPLFLGLLLAAFAAILWWIVLALNIARRLGIERLRVATQTVLAVITVATVLVSMGGLALNLVAPGAATLSLAGLPTAVLPPAWFAAAGLPGGGPAGGWGLAAALLLVAGGLLANARLDGDEMYARFAEVGPEPSRRAPALRALLALTRRPPGSWILPGPARGVAALLLSVGAREEASRLKSLGPRLLLLVFFALSLLRPVEVVGASLVAFAGFFMLIDGVGASGQSATPGAAWPLLAAPLRPAHALLGLRAAIFVRSFALPVALLSIVLVRVHGPAIAALLVFAYLVHGSLVVSLAVAARPALPLTRDQTATPGLLGVLAIQVLGVAAGISFVLMETLAGRLGTIGLVIALLWLVPLVLGSAACWALSAWRLRGLEFGG